ncbi:hypothetical protein NYE44_25225 [Paenibacillus sp. FSL L8-0493]|nr:hypothetical protein [Paenibacillus odorifer]
MKERIEFLKKLRNVIDEIVKAMEAGDDEGLESAVGRYLFLAMQMETLK